MTVDSRRPVVTVAELASALTDQPPPVLLDVRWQVAGPSQYPAYLAGHLPGAQWCDLDSDLADPPGPRGRHPLPEPTRLQARLRFWGIDPGSEVVVYDGESSIAAARAWWVLRWAGQHRVRVLDGGFAAWAAAGQPVQTAIDQPKAGTAVVRIGAMGQLDAAGAGRLAGHGRLIDVRAAERFRGEVEPMDPVAGHIPGAVNLPTTGNITPSGRFLDAADLRRRFDAVLGPAETASSSDARAETDGLGGTDGVGVAGETEGASAGAGVSGAQAVGVYCGSGVTAAHTVLAMQLAGIEAVLYPGSWSEWITDPARPIATG